jgi:hypothetical protein
MSTCLSSRRLGCCVDTCISVLSGSHGRLLCQHVCYQADIVGCSSFMLLSLHVYYQAVLVDRSVDTVLSRVCIRPLF